MTPPSPFEAPQTPEVSDAWRKPVSWAMKLVAIGLLALSVLPTVVPLFFILVTTVHVEEGWLLRLLMDSVCGFMCTALPAAGLWVGANAIGYPETHALTVLDHNELRAIYNGKDLKNAPNGDPGDYLSLSDRDLADVFSALDERAKRYPELLAAIKMRIEAEDTDD
jgi:hypothetical protein